MPSSLQRSLTALFRRPVAVNPQHRDALQAQLLAGLPAAPARRRVWPSKVFGGVLVAGALAGACVLPSEYEMPLGQRVTISIGAEHHEDLDPEVLGAFVAEEFHAQRIEVAMMMHRAGDAGDATGQPQPQSQGELSIELMAFGAQDMPDDLAAQLVAAFPVLEDATVAHAAVEGTVQGTLGGRLSHAWLDVVIDEHGVEEARRRLLQDLARQGIEGDAQVEVIDEPGHREVKVRVETRDPAG
jgi:hypothetical protein